MAIDKKTFVGVFDSTNVNKFYNIYTSDATISELNEMAALPADALIISSPIYSDPETKTAYDLGKPAIVMTDSYGTPLTLTCSFDTDTFEINNNTNTVKIKPIAGLDSMVDAIKVQLEEIKQSVSQTLESKFNKLVQSRAVLPNNDGTSLVSFIDNTTYELKLETWQNQKMTINDSYNGYTGLKSYTFVIPGVHYKYNTHKYIYANYNAYSSSLDTTTSKMEVSVCLSYVIHSAYINSLLNGRDALKYSIENNNCFNYINSYFITNYYRDLDPPQSQTTQPQTTEPSTVTPDPSADSTSTTVIPTTTAIPSTTSIPNSSFTPPTSINVLQLFNREYSYVLNDIIAVGDNSSYIITTDITMNGNKVGSYTFLRFPYDFVDHSTSFNFQIKEGFSYLASNTCKIRLNWEWDITDLPNDIYVYT